MYQLKQDKKEKLQQLQDSFANITDLSVVILDKNDEEMTTVSNLTQFSKLIQSTVEAKRSTASCIKQLTNKCKSTKLPSISLFSDIGVLLIGVPIITAGGTYYGCMMMGPIRCPVGHKMEQLTNRWDIQKTVLCNAKEKLPHYEEKNLEMIVDFAISITEHMIQSELLDLHQETSGVKHKTLLYNGAQTDIAVYICDSKTGAILFVNSQFAGRLDLQIDEILGKNCSEILPYCHHMINHDYCHNCIKKNTNFTNVNFMEPYTWKNYDPMFQKTMRYECQNIGWTDGRNAIMTVIQDIVGEENSVNELDVLAYHNQITDLPNEHQLARGQKESRGNMETGGV